MKHILFLHSIGSVVKFICRIKHVKAISPKKEENYCELGHES